MAEPPLEQAMELRTELVEILKQLNRAEMEANDVDGLEVDELRHMLTRTVLPQASGDDVRRALDVLVGNGMALAIRDSEYAWDRGRVVNERYTITTPGKEFLLRQLQRVNRI